MAHQWEFVRAGGFDQVKLTTGADLVALGELDQKLWVALACPVRGLEFDARTLDLIDTDNDQRVRASELIAATTWAGEMVSNHDVLAKGQDALALIDIAEGDAGDQLRKTAKAILAEADKPDAEVISVTDTATAHANFEATAFNGDGIIVEDSAGGDDERQVITDILATAAEAATDRSGKAGVDQGMIDAFYTEIEARIAWLDAGAGDDVRPLGDETGAAYGALQTVRGKIDDFFARCRVAAFDPRALEAVNREEKEYLTIAANDLQVTAEEVAHFPIAMVEAGKPLTFDEGINPAWATEIAALKRQVLEPLLGKDASTSLDESAWQDVCGRFAAHAGWLASEAGSSVGGLGDDRIRALGKGDAKAALAALVEKDLAQAPIGQAIEDVERLVRYVRDLMPLANNFVAMKDFYARSGPATFQAGTLFLDQRACELCIEVNDAKKHAAMAHLSSAYLLYCDIKNASGAKKTIVAAMTNGDVDNLIVGRNGIFYDRDGEDWDATVTKIVENPISVRQAFFSPYKRFLRAIEGLIASRAAAAETASQAKVDGAAAAAGSASGGAAVESKPIDVGMVAALGVAVGGITAALGALLQSFFGLGIWMPLGVLGLVLLISGPSMAVAWLKLRQRNLGPLLDANGWAVNAQAKLNVPLGASLTAVAALPKGSKRDLRDPYAARTQPWGLYIFLFVVLGLGLSWGVGKIDGYLPPPAKSTTVLGDWAPSADAAPAPEATTDEEAPPAE